MGTQWAINQLMQPNFLLPSKTLNLWTEVRFGFILGNKVYLHWQEKEAPKSYRTWKSRSGWEMEFEIMRMYCFLTSHVHLDHQQVIFLWPWLLCYQPHIQMSKRLGACALAPPLFLEAAESWSRRCWRWSYPNLDIVAFLSISRNILSVLCAASCCVVKGCWLCCAWIFLALLRPWLLVLLCFRMRLHLSRILSLAYRLFSFFPSSGWMFTSEISPAQITRWLSNLHKTPLALLLQVLFLNLNLNLVFYSTI